jgi:hypothetical protein
LSPSEIGARMRTCQAEPDVHIPSPRACLIESMMRTMSDLSISLSVEGTSTSESLPVRASSNSSFAETLTRSVAGTGASFAGGSWTWSRRSCTCLKPVPPCAAHLGDSIDTARRCGGKASAFLKFADVDMGRQKQSPLASFAAVGRARLRGMLRHRLEHWADWPHADDELLPVSLLGAALLASLKSLRGTRWDCPAFGAALPVTALLVFEMTAPGC